MTHGEVDVRPAADGQWLATCDCGAVELVDSAEAGWQWVLVHPCDVVDIPAQATAVVDIPAQATAADDDESACSKS